MRTPLFALAVVAILVAFVVPGSSQTEDMCPVTLEGTTITAEDTADGVAMVLANSAGQAEALRQRVQGMAAHHGEMHGAATSPLAAATVTVENTEFGARVLVVPADAAQLDAVRGEVHALVEQMQTGTCPMMDHTQAAAEGSGAMEGTGAPAEGTGAPAAP